MLARHSGLLIVLFLLGSWQVCGQTAQEIIDGAFKNYAEAGSFSVLVSARQFNVMFANGDDLSRYQVLGRNHAQYEVKWRQPQDWMVIKTTMSFYKEHHSRAEMSALSRQGNEAPQFLTLNGTRVTSQRIASQNAESHVTRFWTTPSLIQDADVLAQLRRGNAETGTIAWGLVEPVLLGDSHADGQPCFLIAAQNLANRRRTLLWISKDKMLLLRVLSYTTMQSMRNRESEGNGPLTVTFSETFYMQQSLNPILASSAFTPPSLGKADDSFPNRVGFASTDELLRQVAAAPGGVMGTTPSAPKPARTPAPEQMPAQVASQALSMEQMSGIVLVEGNGGAGSGFMTKIRDVDFVVTNLHVIGGNNGFKLKNLRGEDIPYAGIFGAVGSDIAIIRIAQTQGELKLAEDVLESSKIGDKVVVVGNRLGGGVATQTSGRILGVGPTRVEVDANFEPGNSGSPIVNLGTNEVVGVATYSETRRVQVEDRAGSAGRTNRASSSGTVEKHWFGYRIDSVSKWEAIDLARWNAQAERVGKFREMSEALVAVIRFNFQEARQHPRLGSILDGFESRYRSAGGNSLAAAVAVKDLFRVVLSISNDGVRELESGDYYDYYWTCLYWENSIPSQLEYRKAIIEVLKKYEANSSTYLSRMRGGS